MMKNESVYFDRCTGQFFKSKENTIDDVNRKLEDGLIETVGELLAALGLPCYMKNPDTLIRYGENATKIKKYNMEKHVIED